MKLWNIKARSDTCRTCNKLFTDNELFFSRLDFGEGGYSRRDFCSVCWNDSAKKNALSVWKSVFKLPPPPAPEALKKETAESLLRELMETEDPTNRNTIYILAIMLERRRILTERDVQTREDGVKVRVYEHRKTGETFLVPDPGLKLSELKAVQEEVVVRLGGRDAGQTETVAAADASAFERNEKTPLES
jgi:hypothetical protein